MKPLMPTGRQRRQGKNKRWNKEPEREKGTTWRRRRQNRRRMIKQSRRNNRG